MEEERKGDSKANPGLRQSGTHYGETARIYTQVPHLPALCDIVKKNKFSLCVCFKLLILLYLLFSF